MTKRGQARSQTALLAPRFDHLFIYVYLYFHGNAYLVPGAYYRVTCLQEPCQHFDHRLRGVDLRSFNETPFDYRKCGAKSGNIFCKTNSEQDANQTQRRCSKKLVGNLILSSYNKV